MAILILALSSGLVSCLILALGPGELRAILAILVLLQFACLLLYSAYWYSEILGRTRDLIASPR